MSRRPRDPGAPAGDGLVGRRQFLGGAAVGAGSLLAARRHPVVEAARATRPAGSDLGAVEHVVFLMQENRSFDHYFGSHRGVLGFDDHPSDSYGVFAQPFAANTTRPPTGVQLPFHLDTTTGRAECTHDIAHDWVAQHLSWHDGAMDAFVSTHTSARYEGPDAGRLTMGYYTRADLGFHYALADAFTICDHYFCSVLGPTHPNRLMALSGSIDPAGRHGGPVLMTNPSPDVLFSAHWTSVPELLEDAHVTWKTYTPPGQGYLPHAPQLGFGDAILPYFAAYRSPASALHRRAFTPTYPGDFTRDVRAGTLPQVSWIIAPNGYDEHPSAPPAYGEWFVSRVLATLVANPRVWARTVVFLTYDENGGFFDHVAPPTPPTGTPGEWVRSAPLPPAAGGLVGPIGLGFRVPMLVVSPFSRGGYLSSEVFDHTSQIRFLEARFGIRDHQVSAWRRATVGDLTSTLRTSHAVLALPRLPSTRGYRTRALGAEGCTPGDVAETATVFPPVGEPATQSQPAQEPGTLRPLAP
ncbi:MAG: phospholipase [Acidobacteriota bacterium]|nr:phospholipase [Acidobacteriota bacterium]